MQSEEVPPPAMSDSMGLDGDVVKLAEYYDSWAQQYDKDVADHDYGLPPMIVNALQSAADSDASLAHLRNPDTAITDAGCGTGLVGVALAEAGYRVIDGVDLSQEMVEIAAERGIYRRLTHGIDLTKPLPDDLVRTADVVTVAGVFTVGHVPPEALAVMSTIVKPGGVLIASTRRAYFEQTNYQQVSDDLNGNGTLELILRIDDAPYTMDSTAHYWAYLVK